MGIRIRRTVRTVRERPVGDAAHVLLLSAHFEKPSCDGRPQVSVVIKHPHETPNRLSVEPFVGLDRPTASRQNPPPHRRPPESSVTRSIGRFRGAGGRRGLPPRTVQRRLARVATCD